MLPARAAVLICLLAAPAAAQTACPVHTVASGDTLRRIAERYLGSPELSGLVYARNRDLIGANADRITPGMRLTVPCEGGIAADLPATSTATATAGPGAAPPASGDGRVSGWTGPTPTDSAPAAPAARLSAVPAANPAPDPVPNPAPDPVPAPDPKIAAQPTAPGSASGLTPAAAGAGTAEVGVAGAGGDSAPPSPAAPTPASAPGPDRPAAGAQLHLVTGGPYQPYVAPAAGDGGLIPVLVTAALDTTDGPAPRIAFVNDRDAHVTELLPRGVYTLSFPWVFPDCTAPDLPPTGIRLCQDYVASDSLYEQVTEFYALSAGPFAEATTLAALEGARICRPEGWPVDDLLAAGLLPDRARLLTRPDPGGCLDALDGGAADIASMDAMLARAIAGRRNLDNPLVVLEPLSRVEGLRAVARADDPEGRAAIERLNRGLRAIAESGTWFDLVRAQILFADG
ncbi:LysM peptidoglycan-binding domain-containing protein [Rhodobacteraceae bacterium 2CG4]|uniref:LysM peptidoglycan-binding domain-containing protein n=1 Tax=Halovulum marinum TaxID=2662447 RepID=A0A6L5Z868_9RHOB|nr:LysM peptidoglycan-binding domain-containing protein [Halovulum marinum]MSU92112.1 LysM peptidoglycan-binding domain-containing protein [Halovulum marinum]